MYKKIKEYHNFLKAEENKLKLIRDICIEAIYIFFDYNIVENFIKDEYYEIFFENSWIHCNYGIFNTVNWIWMWWGDFECMFIKCFV